MVNGEAIRTAREARSLSQAQLAEELGINELTVWRWENKPTRRIDYVMATRLAALLEVSADDLFHAPEADTASTGQGENQNDGAGRDLTGNEIAATGARGE